MKFIEGGQLDKIAGSKPISVRKAAELAAKLARTLHYAHQHGVLHRDVKPGNILIDQKGEPHLTDFGLARLVETESTVTRTMEVLGTPSYMAPEQAVGNNRAISSATDVYGLGAVLYQLLTGHPPFAGVTTYETARLVLETEPRQPRFWNPKVDRDLATICLKCLEKEPAKRYASAQALAEDLERFLRNEPIHSRRISRLERVWRWCKRKPLVASLTAAVVMAVTVGSSGVLLELRRVQEEQALLRRANLSPQEKVRLQAKRSNNPAAYEAYLRGRAFLAGSWLNDSNINGAIQFYQEAVKLDPSFALAWARLSWAQSRSYFVELDPTPARLAAAKDALDHALALDPNLPEVHLALGYYRYHGQRDYAGALAEFRQVEQGLPNNVEVMKAIAIIHRRLGHWDDAITGLRHVIELDPRNIDASIILTGAYRCVRRFPEALATIDRALAWEPTNGAALSLKASALWATGDLQAVEPLLANPNIDPTVGARYALFQRRYADAKNILSRALPTETKREARASEKLREKLLPALSQQRAGDVVAARATYQRAAQDIQREIEKVV
jgi:serine/threonine protein kinase